MDDYTETKKAQESSFSAPASNSGHRRPTLMFGWFDRKHVGWLARFMQRCSSFSHTRRRQLFRQPFMPATSPPLLRRFACERDHRRLQHHWPRRIDLYRPHPCGETGHQLKDVHRLNPVRRLPGPAQAIRCLRQEPGLHRKTTGGPSLTPTSSKSSTGPASSLSGQRRWRKLRQLLLSCLLQRGARFLMREASLLTSYLLSIKLI